MASVTPSPPAISLRNAVALSGRFPLLAGVDLDIATGESVLVEGPNGAGKTSLLRVCAGLVPAASGDVRVLGLDPSAHRGQVRRRVGMLSHASHLYDDLNVQENVRFAVLASGSAAGRIDAACDRWGLSGRLLTTSASKLSAGQRRRVALAVLTARWPEVWLLDEPHAGLDASARATLDTLLADASSDGITVIIASHEAEVVESLALRAVTITGGRVTGERRTGRRETAAPAVVPSRPVPSADDGVVTGRRWALWRDSWLVAAKDLRIEARSKVGMSQVAPFGVVALVLFAFALGPDRSLMARGAPGLFWVAVLFSTVLAIQRSVSVDSADGARDGLRLSGLDPAGLFLGKSVAVGVQLIVLECVLGAGVVLLYGAHIEALWLIAASCLLGTVGLAATGTLYGALSAGLRVKETLLPFLLLPIVAPVLLAGTRIWQAAMAGGTPGDGNQWLRLLAVFDAVYLALGVVIYGPIQETA